MSSYRIETPYFKMKILSNFVESSKKLASQFCTCLDLTYSFIYLVGFTVKDKTRRMMKSDEERRG